MSLSFVKSKIQRYGFFGVWKYAFIKYSAALLYKTGLCRFFVIHHKAYNLHFSKTNVAYWLYLQRDLHDGDIAEMQSKLKSGDTIVDVGANIGSICIPIAKHIGNGGTVYAIEAHPRTCAELRKNISLNKITNIKTFQIAIGDKNGLVHFTDIQSDDMNKVDTKADARPGTLTVPMMRLDDVCRDIPVIHMLKIDVEGYEKFLLEHATETLKKTKHVYVEYLEQETRAFGYPREEIRKTLEAHGFSCEIASKDGHYNKDIDNLICTNVHFT